MHKKVIKDHSKLVSFMLIQHISKETIIVFIPQVWNENIISKEYTVCMS